MKYKIEKNWWGLGYFIMDENEVCKKHTFTLWGAKREIKRAKKLDSNERRET